MEQEVKAASEMSKLQEERIKSENDAPAVRQKAEAQQKQEEIHEEELEATSPYRENLIQNILCQNEDASRMDAANRVGRSRSPPRVRTASIRDFFS